MRALRLASTAWRRHRWVGLGLTLSLVLALGGSLAYLLPGRAHAATIPVSTCTEAALDAAVAAASPGDTVTFGCSGTITLTSTLAIAKNLVLDGSGQSVTLDGNHSVRVLMVASGVTFTLTHLTVANGLAAGGFGGGISNGGTTTLTNSTVSGNSAGGGGGIVNIGATATLTLTNSTVSGNSATSGGGIYLFMGGSVTLTNSTVSGNSATNGGGGINSFCGTVTMNSSTVSGNSANDGGGLVVSTFKTCTPITTITNSTFAGNSASFRGGGIFNTGTMTLANSTVSGNSATGGGGIFNGGTMTLTNSTVSGNSATCPVCINAIVIGGGILSAGGTVTITNSTVSGNSVSCPGCIDISEIGGGGFFNEGGTVTLSNSTVSGNGGGILSATGTVTLTETIVANNAPFDCLGPSPSPFIDGGYNLDDDTSCGLSAVHHSLPGTNPHLAASLAHNGGPTQTLALLSGSPAIDAGGTSANGCLATDQRGVSRPQGAACDIGAYEFVPTTTTTLTANPNPGLLDQPVQLCATVAPTLGAPGPSSGSVSFTEGATTLGTGSLNSSSTGCFTTSSLSLGDHTITASYGGSGVRGFNGSSSAPLVVSIQVQGQDVAGGGSGGTPPYNPPSQGQSTGGQNDSGNGAGQTQPQHQQQATNKPGGAFTSWLGTGLGLLLLLLGLGGLGAVFYRASRRRPAQDVGLS